MEQLKKSIAVLFATMLMLPIALVAQSLGEPGRENDGPNPLKNIYFGEQHMHTKNSFDAFTIGSGTWAQDSRLTGGGMGFGALAGGLIGALLGPGGAMAGAAVGGSVGGMIGHHENVKFDDPVMDNFATSLVNDSSALILGTPVGN